jgi:hypothetical protein
MPTVVIEKEGGRGGGRERREKEVDHTIYSER